MLEAELDTFRESFRTFVERDVLGSSAEELGAAELVARMFAVAGEYGFLAMAAPEEHGGAGVDDIRFPLAAVEELTRLGLTGAALVFAAHSALAIPMIARHGTDAQRERWLPPLASGKLTATAAGLAGGARGLRSDAGFVLEGAAESAVHLDADLAVVAFEDEDGHVRLALMTSDTAGFEREPDEGALTVAGTGVGTVRFSAAVVPESDVLPGRPTEAEVDERVLLAAVAVSGARAALVATLDYVRERSVFGRTVASFQNTRYVVADVIAELALVESFVDSCVADRLAGRLAPERAAAAKLRATELFGLVADHGLQLHGGYGYMREYAISQAFADARFLRLHGGSEKSMKESLAVAAGL